MAKQQAEPKKAPGTVSVCSMTIEHEADLTDVPGSIVSASYDGSQWHVLYHVLDPDFDPDADE